MMRNFILIMLLSLISACGKPEMPSPFHAKDISWQYGHADFRLVDFNGKPHSLSDFRGKVVVLFFGYTHCPLICPTTLADLAQVMRQLDKDANRVQVLFVTLDPERDNPEMLAKFVPSFNSSFLGLYGNAQATSQAAKAFGVKYEKQYDKHGSYTLDHSDRSYLIGLGGKPMLLSPYGQRVDLLAQDIRLLLTIGR
jgi:protein SCO1/2